ncbi:MAG: PepSY domain-containing protein [Gammaproteobacteria bacterium]|nr:PepSY domain-containing protein [Gammaproteobacteria bacterium]MBU2059548.1 PepSY domain-containing protein [Gammaproteobacteria bacterium]MBU2174395.1 PepSY domain-containing protein [Gammaproteobacteria bacterium]MBU2248020.1 PepSY domain-containing protein [Gammaproteobacteria bacterium]MBU2345490.1 PepSY domain-containing protein [Gammaproteobacteria bacterium]
MAKKLHRFFGLILALWLVPASLTGAVLLYKNLLLQWLYPQLQQPLVTDLAIWGKVLDALPQRDYRFVRLANTERPWLELSRLDGSLEYWSASGELLLSRSQYQDFIGWCYEFHLHLFSADVGEQMIGVLGLLALLLVGSGLWQSWPRHWRWKLWRLPWSASSIRWSRQWHFVIAFWTAPLLVLTSLTGTAMLYNQQVQQALSWLFSDAEVTLPEVASEAYPVTQSQWALWLPVAQKQLPDGALRLASFRKKAEQELSIRAQLTGEWHPNGRTLIKLDPASSGVLSVQKATEMGQGKQLSQMIYPLHMAAVGGEFYKILLLLTGLIPLLLWGLGLVFYTQRQTFGKDKKTAP